MAAKRPLSGYPAPIGSTVLSIFPHTGPVSYTQIAITPGTVPITGGDTVQALPEAGMKWFDNVIGGVTDDGAFVVRAIPVTISNPGQQLTGIPSKTFKLQWIALKTATYGGQAQTAGSEAAATTDLHTFCVRLTAFGPK